VQLIDLAASHGGIYRESLGRVFAIEAERLGRFPPVRNHPTLDGVRVLELMWTDVRSDSDTHATKARGKAGLVLVTAIVAAALSLAGPASAAAPNYIFVSGPGLSHPVLLADWSQNLVLLSALVNAQFAPKAVIQGLRNRTRLRLAEFWGWGDGPPPTRPSQANQYGWFYPAGRGRAAVFAVMVNGTNAPRIAPARALRILAAHGIPIRR
jgi:hypothetical protein